MLRSSSAITRSVFVPSTTKVVDIRGGQTIRGLPDLWQCESTLANFGDALVPEVSWRRKIMKDGAWAECDIDGARAECNIP